MATSVVPVKQAENGERPFAHLRATPEERAQVLASLTPFDAEAWRREVTPGTFEDQAAIEEFLRDREDH